MLHPEQVKNPDVLQCIVQIFAFVYECCLRQSPKIDPLTADISLFNMADAAAAAKLHVQANYKVSSV